jgi:predicted esterase
VGEALTRKMPGHAAGSFRERMTSTSHYDVPVTYLKCMDDKIIYPAHQQKMIDDFKSISRSTVNVVEIASGHCPMVEHVKETTKVIVQAAGD